MTIREFAAPRAIRSNLDSASRQSLDSIAR
jgi:hypothetical protein